MGSDTAGGQARLGPRSGQREAFTRPETGNVFVTLTVTYTNKLNVEKNANPSEFVLKDGVGIKRTWCPMLGGSSSTWDAVNLTPGSTFGPKCESFEAAAGHPTGLVLTWTPSLGVDYNIKLS